MIYPCLQLSMIIYPSLQLSKMIFPCLQLSKMVHTHLHLSQMIFQDQWCGCTWWGQFLFHQLCLLKIASRIYVWGHPVLALGKCCVLWWQVIWCCRWWSPHSKWRLIFTWHEVRFFFLKVHFHSKFKKIHIHLYFIATYLCNNAPVEDIDNWTWSYSLVIIYRNH